MSTSLWYLKPGLGMLYWNVYIAYSPKSVRGRSSISKNILKLSLVRRNAVFPSRETIRRKGNPHLYLMSATRITSNYGRTILRCIKVRRDMSGNKEICVPSYSIKGVYCTILIIVSFTEYLWILHITSLGLSLF